MSLINNLKIAVLGATGYTGLDLVFMLSKHPKVKICYLCATKKLGKNISYFDKRIKKKLPKISSINKIDWKNMDVVFLSLPNGEAQKIIKKVYSKFKNIKFIDLSADFRINNPKIYFKNYRKKHRARSLIRKALYSISEFNKKKIHKFRIIANPGCYPTSIQIPLIPIIKKGLVKNNDIVIDSKSGFSGAGKNFRKKFTHKNILSSTFAYGIKNHRHSCELKQELEKLTGKKISFTFNPHLIPTFRGILSSIYLRTNNNVSAKRIQKVLKNFYLNSKFVKILKLNSHIGTGEVINTNKCQISVCETNIKNKIVIFSAIDNLIKGASGQAIQNMNLLFNYNENEGLK